MILAGEEESLVEVVLGRPQMGPTATAAALVAGRRPEGTRNKMGPTATAAALAGRRPEGTRNKMGPTATAAALVAI